MIRNATNADPSGIRALKLPERANVVAWLARQFESNCS
jgi:hypothetical protein